jgi:hypothetical protein
MNFKEAQRQHQVDIREALFNDPGFGYYKTKLRPFVLQNPFLNLWEGIREDALAYFKRYKIGWWDSGAIPTGHLLSSQISCINHLFLLRQREDLATAILHSIDPTIVKALKVDSGFVEFEKVGKKKLGKEKQHTRGANCTSIDAMMLGLRQDNAIVLVLVEWKYTEEYKGKPSKANGASGQVRLDAYEELLLDNNCPIEHKPVEDLYFEPFYQLMRQTLLAWQMVERKEYEAVDYLHIDIIPKDNIELRNVVTSPGLTGKTVYEAWLNALKPEARPKYKTLSNEDFMKPIFDSEKIDIYETRTLKKYLNIRYFKNNNNE